MQPTFASERSVGGARPGQLLLLWLLAGGAMLLLLGTPPVRRTQEARVLETARQMLGSGIDGWLLPQLNGQPRLKKPPLTYWMSAGMYKLFGVSETAGRMPSVIAGWLTLGLTYAIARRLFGDSRTALFCAACLLGSYLFFRFNRLAETDSPATFFVTLAIYAMLRASDFEIDLAPRSTSLSIALQLVWMCLAGVGIGGAVMSKGPPGAYPIVFLLSCSLVFRVYKPLVSFAIAAAPTAAIIGGTWYVYVYKKGFFGILRNEIANAAGGGDHGKPFYQYIPMLLIAVAPWTVVWVVAAWKSMRDFRRDRAMTVVVLWAGSILLPLVFIGNKQFHYLLTAMPPIAMMTGTLISRTARRVDERTERRDAQGVRSIVIATIALTLLVGIATPIAGIALRRHVLPIDLLVSAISLPSAALIYSAWRRGRFLLAIGVYGLAVTVGISLLDARWILTIQTANPRSVAAYVSEHVGAGPYCFYGGNVSLPLCFNLRTAIPSFDDDQLIRQQPGLIVIAVGKDGAAPRTPPDRYVVPIAAALTDGEQVFNFYRLIRSNVSDTSR